MTRIPGGELDGDDQVATASRLLSETAVLRHAGAYLARRSASRAHLRRVLERRLSKSFDDARSRSDAKEAIQALLDRVLDRLTRAGLIDDAAYAVSKARGLAGKGLPVRRIRHELEQRGVAWAENMLPEGFNEMDQARRYAIRKRLGPYRVSGRPASPEKDMRALLRAGFSLAAAREALQSEADEGADPDCP